MSEIHVDLSRDLCAARVSPLANHRCTMADVLRLMQVPNFDLEAAERVPATMRRLSPGDTLFHEGTHAETLYFVRGGTFKLTCTAEDGYEQVLGFADVRELLGQDALGVGEYPSTAVALDECSVYGVPMRDVLSLSQQLPAFNAVLHRAASLGLRRRAQLVDVLAAVSAEVRLARFLVQWSRRMGGMGLSTTRFHLRMCRRDIASYLGVAHATVSRSFGALADWGLLSVSNRDVEILGLAGLERLARSTRRNGEDAAEAPRLRGMTALGASVASPRLGPGAGKLHAA